MLTTGSAVIAECGLAISKARIIAVGRAVAGFAEGTEYVIARRNLVKAPGDALGSRLVAHLGKTGIG